MREQPVSVLPDPPLKRLLDLVASAAGLVALSPLMAVLALAVRASSPGPVFFRQQRVGRGGKPFWLYKFRTMRLNQSGPAVTSGSDRRITPVGAWLRASKLDELPQLINVARGEMSLVGPRPEVPQYVAHYTPEQRQVLAVRPGITGISQVRFRNEQALLAGREDVEGFYLSAIMPAKLALDLEYVRHRSLLLDVALLWRTVAAILLPQPDQPVMEAAGLPACAEAGTTPPPLR